VIEENTSTLADWVDEQPISRRRERADGRGKRKRVSSTPAAASTIYEKDESSRDV
jgi:hypothetical protein